MRKIVASVSLLTILASDPASAAFAQNHSATFREIAADTALVSAFKATAKGH